MKKIKILTSSIFLFVIILSSCSNSHNQCPDYGDVSGKAIVFANSVYSYDKRNSISMYITTYRLIEGSCNYVWDDLTPKEYTKGDTVYVKLNDIVGDY